MVRRSFVGFLVVLSLAVAGPMLAQDGAQPGSPTPTPELAVATPDPAVPTPAVADAATTETIAATPTPIPAPTPTPEPTPRPTPPPRTTVTAEGKIRGIWVDMEGAELYNSLESISRIVQNIADANFSDVYLIVARGGTAMYPSKMLEKNAAVRSDLTDPVAAFLEKANGVIDRRTNSPKALRVHLVMLPLESFRGKSLAAAPSSHVLNRHPNWALANDTARDRQDSDLFTLDPALDEVHDYLAQMVAELVTRYPSASGIQFHEMRYPGVSGRWGFGDMSLNRYMSATGVSQRPTPEDGAFAQWRRDRMTALLTKLTQTVREKSPTMTVGVTGFVSGPAPDSDATWRSTDVFDGALQDWDSWARNGVVDEVMLLNSFSEKYDIGKFDGWLTFAFSKPLKSRLIVGMGQAENFAEDILNQVRRALMTPAAGVALFSYQEPNIEDIRGPLFQALANTIFSADSSKQFRPSNIQVDAGFEKLLMTETPVVDAAAERPEFSFDTPPTATPEPGAVAATGPDGQPAATPEPTPRPLLLPDEITLTNAQLLKGRILTETPAMLIIRLESGVEINIPREEIREIKRATN